MDETIKLYVPDEEQTPCNEDTESAEMIYKSILLMVAQVSQIDKELQRQ